MPKAYFLAPSHQQATYWMNQWGFTEREVVVLTPERMTHGYRFTEPVFFCGNRDALDPIYDAIMPCLDRDNAEIISAEDLFPAPCPCYCGGTEDDCWEQK